MNPANVHGNFRFYSCSQIRKFITIWETKVVQILLKRSESAKHKETNLNRIVRFHRWRLPLNAFNLNLLPSVRNRTFYPSHPLISVRPCLGYQSHKCIKRVCVRLGCCRFCCCISCGCACLKRFSVEQIRIALTSTSVGVHTISNLTFIFQFEFSPNGLSILNLIHSNTFFIQTALIMCYRCRNFRKCVSTKKKLKRKSVWNKQTNEKNCLPFFSWNFRLNEAFPVDGKIHARAEWMFCVSALWKSTGVAHAVVFIMLVECRSDSHRVN